MAQNKEQLDSQLFAGGEPGVAGTPALLKQYEIFVATSETLSARRQNVNAFFLSANSIILAAAGLLWSNGQTGDLESLALIALGYAGSILCFAWRKLIRSYRQLSQGKFAVIHALERKLPAQVFEAEWVALGKGKDSKKYTPFTQTERTTPFLFGAVQLFVAGAGLVSLYRVLFP